MERNLFKLFMRLFNKHTSQPMIVPKMGANPTKKGFSVPTKTLKARRKALRLRQKQARRANRRT